MDGIPNASPKELFCRTRLCKFYMSGRCKQGEKCTFAHGTTNMAQKPNFFHTRMCPILSNTGSCPRGDKCSYAHCEQELRPGVTKATSNASNVARVCLVFDGETKETEKRTDADPIAKKSLKQLLYRHGFPSAPGLPPGLHHQAEPDNAGSPVLTRNRNQDQLLSNSSRNYTNVKPSIPIDWAAITATHTGFFAKACDVDMRIQACLSELLAASPIYVKHDLVDGMQKDDDLVQRLEL